MINELIVPDTTKSMDVLQSNRNVGEALARPGEMRRRAIQRRVRAGLSGIGDPIAPEERLSLNQSYGMARAGSPNQNFWADILKKYYRTVARSDFGVGHLGGGGGVPGNIAVPIGSQQIKPSAQYGQKYSRGGY